MNKTIIIIVVVLVIIGIAYWYYTKTSNAKLISTVNSGGNGTIGTTSTSTSTASVSCTDPFTGAQGTMSVITATCIPNEGASCKQANGSQGQIVNGVCAQIPLSVGGNVYLNPTAPYYDSGGGSTGIPIYNYPNASNPYRIGVIRPDWNPGSSLGTFIQNDSTGGWAQVQKGWNYTMWKIGSPTMVAVPNTFWIGLGDVQTTAQ